MKVVNLKLEADTNSGPPGVVVEFDDGSRVDFGLSGYAGDWYIVPENRTIKDYLPKAEEAMKAACKRYRNSLSDPRLEALASFCNRIQQAPKVGLHGLGGNSLNHGRTTGYIGEERDISRLEGGWYDVTHFIERREGSDAVASYFKAATTRQVKEIASWLVDSFDAYSADDAEAKFGRLIAKRGLEDVVAAYVWNDMLGEIPEIHIKLA